MSHADRTEPPPAQPTAARRSPTRQLRQLRHPGREGTFTAVAGLEGQYCRLGNDNRRGGAGRGVSRNGTAKTLSGPAGKRSRSPVVRDSVISLGATRPLPLAHGGCQMTQDGSDSGGCPTLPPRGDCPRPCPTPDPQSSPAEACSWWTSWPCAGARHPARPLHKTAWAELSPVNPAGLQAPELRWRGPERLAGKRRRGGDHALLLGPPAAAALALRCCVENGVSLAARRARTAL